MLELSAEETVAVLAKRLAAIEAEELKAMEHLEKSIAAGEAVEAELESGNGYKTKSFISFLVAARKSTEFLTAALDSWHQHLTGRPVRQ